MRELAKNNGVPMLPGSGLVSDLEHAKLGTEKIRYPVMLKATAGWGGIGMRVCAEAGGTGGSTGGGGAVIEGEFKETEDLSREILVAVGRHIEVQIFGDGKGMCWPWAEAGLLGAAAESEGD